MSNLKELLNGNGPTALVFKRTLDTIDGDRTVYPPTYSDGQYNFIVTPNGNECILDSFGSQANRLQRTFIDGKFAHLVPRCTIAADSVSLDGIELAHRIADTALRATTGVAAVAEALMEAAKGNYIPVATILPTSYVFGFWDSRGDSRMKWPRIVSAQIKATGVSEPNKRGAQLMEDGKRRTLAVEVLGGMGVDRDNMDQTTRKKVSQNLGMISCITNSLPAGVHVSGDIVQNLNINLVLLRKLHRQSPELGEYLLGLALAAVCGIESTDGFYYLRQGCHLMVKDTHIWAVKGAERTTFPLNAEDVEQFATKAKQDFFKKYKVVDQTYSTCKKAMQELKKELKRTRNNEDDNA